MCWCWCLLVLVLVLTGAAVHGGAARSELQARHFSKRTSGASRAAHPVGYVRFKLVHGNRLVAPSGPSQLSRRAGGHEERRKPHRQPDVPAQLDAPAEERLRGRHGRAGSPRLTTARKDSTARPTGRRVKAACSVREGARGRHGTEDDPSSSSCSSPRRAGRRTRGRPSSPVASRKKSRSDTVTVMSALRPFRGRRGYLRAHAAHTRACATQVR